MPQANLTSDMNGGQPKSAEQPPQMWIPEHLTPYDVYHHGVKQLLHASNTKYQSMIIADIGNYGRALFLDGKIQTTEGDEAFYHETLVHTPCLIHSSPQSLLVLGGADGGAARQALRWKSISSVVVVDLDRQVVDACRTYLSSISSGAFASPRTKLFIRDALQFIHETTQKFDVIICDLTDPMEDSPSLSLFTDTFFRTLREHLSPRGAISVQAGPASLRENRIIFPRIYATLKQVFTTVRPYQVFVPSYGSPLAMIVATMREDDLPSVDDVDRTLNQLDGELYVLDGQLFHSMFALPRHVKKALTAETVICTEANTAMAYGRGQLTGHEHVQRIESDTHSV